MNDVKSLLASKTIWGVAITVLGLILNAFGFTLTDTDQHGLIDAIANIADAVGPILATYGRVVASKKIG